MPTKQRRRVSRTVSRVPTTAPAITEDPATAVGPTVVASTAVRLTAAEVVMVAEVMVAEVESDTDTYEVTPTEDSAQAQEGTCQSHLLCWTHKKQERAQACTQA